MPVAVAFDWIPDPRIMGMQLQSIGYGIRSFREPLTRSVREVMSPSLRRNFDVGGRPAWRELSWRTLAQKQGNEAILVRTGLLSTVAGQQNIWKIDRETATLGSLPRAQYGMYHQDGTRFMPARPWAVIQSSDADAIVRIFEEWFEERVNRSI